MAQEIGTVYIEVAPSGKNFGKKLEGDLTNAVDKASKTGGTKLTGIFGKAFGTIGKVGLGAISTITGGLATLTAKGGFQRALNIENAQAKLKGLGHDSKSVTEIMNNALASVKGTAFGLSDAATVAASLSASGVRSGDQLTKVLKTVADTAQISGRSLTDIGTIFGSVAARGKLQGDDMLQLMSSGVPVLQFLAKQTGKTSAEVSDMVSKGKIDFATFADAMQAGLGGAALSAGTTFSGAMANVKAALSRIGESAATPVLNVLRDVFNALIPTIDQVAKQTAPFTELFADKLTPIVQQATEWLARFSKQLENGSLTIQDVAGQIGLLAGGFATLASIGGNIDKITSVFDLLGTAGDKGIKTLTGKMTALPGQLQNKITGLQQFKAYFNKDIRDALTLDGDPFANALNRIWQGADKIAVPFQSLASKISGSSVVQSIAGMADKASIGFGKLTSTLDSNIKALEVRVGDGFSGVLSKVSNSKLVSGFSSIANKAKVAIRPIADGLGDAFGGIGDIAGPKLQAGLARVGSMIGTFFSPGNFLKFFGIGALVAALVAGLGMLDQSMGGQLFVQISNLFAELPTMIVEGMAKITEVLPGMIQQGSMIVLALLNGVTGSLPQLAMAGAQILSMLVAGLAQALPLLIPAALNLITTLATSLIAQLPVILTAGMQLLNGIVQGIVAALPQLATAIPQIITTLISALATGLPGIITAGTQILLSLVNGLVSAIPQLAAMIPQIITTIVTTLASNGPQLIQSGVQALVALINGLAQALPQLASYVPQIIASIVSTLASNLPQILNAGVQILITLAGGLAKAIPQLLAMIPQIVQSMWNGFTSVNWGEIGIQIISGIISGIAGVAGRLVDAAKNAASNALNGVKNFLGIHSPSTVFRDQVGMMIGRGMAAGIDRSQKIVDRSMNEIAAGLTLDGHTFRLSPASAYSARGLVALADTRPARQTSVDVSIDARGTDKDVLWAMMNARVEEIANRWG